MPSRTPNGSLAPPPDSVVVRGNSLLDGEPFDSTWVGAVVLKDGLATPCQSALPPVTNGEYTVPVLTATESSGCGEHGGWTRSGRSQRTRSSSAPKPYPGPRKARRRSTPTIRVRHQRGRTGRRAISGCGVRIRGQPLPAGTEVEAFVGATLCGVASVRSSVDFTGYILSVVGPDSIAACTLGAPLTFRIDGEPAAPTTAVNTPPGQRDALDLRLE